MIATYVFSPHCSLETKDAIDASFRCGSRIFQFLNSIICIIICICIHNTQRKFWEHVGCQTLFICVSLTSRIKF